MTSPNAGPEGPLYRPATGRAHVLRMVLAYGLLVAIARGVLFLVAAWLTQRPDVSLARYLDELLVATDVLTIALIVLGAISWLMWVAWTSRLEDNARALGAGAGRIGPRGTIAWWLVPIANLIMPLAVVISIDRRLVGPERRSHDLLIWAWWIVLLLATAGVLVTSGLLLLPTSTVDLRAAQFGAIGIASLAAAMAALLAIRVVYVVQQEEDGLARAATVAWPEDRAYDWAPVPAGAFAPRDTDAAVRGDTPSTTYVPVPGFVAGAATMPTPGAYPAPPVMPMPVVPPPQMLGPGPMPVQAGPMPMPPGAMPPGPPMSMPPGPPMSMPPGLPMPMPPGLPMPMPMPPGPPVPAGALPPGAPPTGGYLMPPDGGLPAYPPPPPAAMPGPPTMFMPVPTASGSRPRSRRRSVSWMVVAAVVALGIALVAGAFIPLDDLNGGPGSSSTPRSSGIAVASPSGSPGATSSGRPSGSPASGPSASPNGSPDSTPNGSAPPTRRPSPSPTVVTAPAGLELLLAHRTAGDGPCVAAPAVSQPAGSTAAIVCDPPNPDVASLIYAAYPSPEQAQQVVETARENAGVGVGSGDCFAGKAGENGYSTNGSQRGRVVCYVSGSGTSKLAHVIWYDRTLSVVGTATAQGTAFDALCQWWSSESGPA